MTNEEERNAQFFLKQAVKRFQGDNPTPSTMIAKDLIALAERLLKENSELRVRDSNVTMHSLNVMAVNEDLVAKLAALDPRNEPHSPCICAEIQRQDSRRHFTGCPLRMSIVDAEFFPPRKFP